MHPCDVLFVHRDSDSQPPRWRYDEIAAAAREHPHVAVVPVKMTEAWLLFDERALRAAAGRPSGRDDLQLPSLSQVERIADPKEVLKQALRRANGATGRRARRFRPSAAMHRLADLIEDWSPLRRLDAFQRLEADTRAVLRSLEIELYDS